MQSVETRVSIRKTFAERNAKVFFRCASVLREKTAICVIIRKSHLMQNCPIPLFCNSIFAQCCNFVIIICVYFWNWKVFRRYLNSEKIWFWNVLHNMFDQWQSRWVPISWARILFISAECWGGDVWPSRRSLFKNVA